MLKQLVICMLFLNASFSHVLLSMELTVVSESSEKPYEFKKLSRSFSPTIKKQLKFSVCDERTIVSWACYNIAFPVKPEQFNLKHFLVALPTLKESDKVKLTSLVDAAFEDLETVRATCLLGDTKYAVKICSTLFNDQGDQVKTLLLTLSELRTIHKKRLNLFLDSNRKIVSSSSEQCELELLPEHTGMEITKVLPLNEIDTTLLTFAFKSALVHKNIIKVTLNLLGKQFIAKVSVLESDTHEEYFIKITEK